MFVNKAVRLCVFASIVLLLVSACTSAQPTDDAANVVVRYMGAKAAGDGETIQSLLCSSLESIWQQEASSFVSVEARLDGASCSKAADSDVVTCTGQIVALYGLESMSFPLSSYNVVQEDGEWKYCGEA